MINNAEMIQNASVSKKLKVAAYCRVSTEHDEQENSLENQIDHYKNEIESNPDYELVDVYYDFGVSGYKEDRPGFKRMIEDAKAGMIDLIITKSVSRFARNTQVILQTTRELKEKGIGVYFELQNMNSLTADGELLMTIYAAFAQAESENARELSKLAYKRKYEAGIPVQYLDRCFGYKKDENGEFFPDANEAKWVRTIYHMAADGYTIAAIMRYLNENGVKTVSGARWRECTVIRIVESEIYKGDYIMHKSYVNQDRKLVKNRGEVDSWYIEDDHVPIVSKRLWNKAQIAVTKRRKYLAEGSDIKERTSDNYQYMGKLFCAYCGCPLYARIYSAGNRLNWGCSGQKRYGKKFCAGVNVPDSIIKRWDLDRTAYVYKKGDSKGIIEYGYYRESYWRRHFKKKEANVKVPKLCSHNYPYKDKLWCARCGYKLTRHFNTNSGKVWWICSGSKHKGKTFCVGVRIPDDEVRKLKPIKEAICVEERTRDDGEKYYCYSRKVNEGNSYL